MGTGWLALTSFSTAFILGRVVFSDLPDRIGGAKVALVFRVDRSNWPATDLARVWPALALFVATLTGLGYSLIYPGFGVEAVRRTVRKSWTRDRSVHRFSRLRLGSCQSRAGAGREQVWLDAMFLVSALVVLCSAMKALKVKVKAHDLAETMRDVHEATVWRVLSACPDLIRQIREQNAQRARAIQQSMGIYSQ